MDARRTACLCDGRCRPRRKRKTVGGYAASARYCCRSGSGTRTASRVCSPDRASRTSIHCIRTAGSCSTRLTQGTVVRFRHQLKAEILREIELIELLLRQIADVEAAREVLAGPQGSEGPIPGCSSQAAQRHRSEIASVLYPRASSEASATAASWQPMRGSRQHPGGAARRPGARHLQSGNPRLRSTMIELAWLWATTSASEHLEPLVPHPRRQ